MLGNLHDGDRLFLCSDINFPALTGAENDEPPFVEITRMVRIRWSDLMQRFQRREKA